MPLTDPRGQNIPYSVLTDKPNAQTLGQGIVEAVASKITMVFNSAAVRGATITAPTAGMVTYLKDVKRVQVYDGTAWRDVFSGASGWQSYSPVWSATTTNPSLGNGTLTATYMKIGNMCQISLMLTIGSSTSKGNGTYGFSLPFQAANTGAGGCPGVLSATFSRSNTPNHGLGDTPLGNGATSTTNIWFPNPGSTGDANVWTHNAPWSYGTGDVFRLFGCYQTAI
ncbi:hypothetical protein [Streptomyces malaysiensis]